MSRSLANQRLRPRQPIRMLTFQKAIAILGLFASITAALATVWGVLVSQDTARVQAQTAFFANEISKQSLEQNKVSALPNALPIFADDGSMLYQGTSWVRTTPAPRDYIIDTAATGADPGSPWWIHPLLLPVGVMVVSVGAGACLYLSSSKSTEVRARYPST